MLACTALVLSATLAIFALRQMVGRPTQRKYQTNAYARGRACPILARSGSAHHGSARSALHAIALHADGWARLI